MWCNRKKQIAGAGKCRIQQKEWRWAHSSSPLEKAECSALFSMNQRTLRVLEYDKVKAMLAEYTAFSLGRERVRWLEPSGQMDVVRGWMEETTQAAALLDREGSVPLGGLSDITPAVRKAEVGSALAPSELLQVRQCLYGIRRLSQFLAAKTDDFPTIHELGSRLQVFPQIEEEIDRCIGEDGEVLDRASSELARIRGQIRTLQNRVREKLDSIIRSPQYQRVLQENIVTMRNGRYVVPVKAEHKGAVPGIVHDQSGSGATLFIEPAAVVELNNRIRQLEADEQEEIHRILQQLTGLVSQLSRKIIYSLEIAGRIDFIVAKARFSHAVKGHAPLLNDKGYIKIVRGRHPLLKGEVVPLDLWLGREATTLVITGPNTGGKTVALKTVGLLTLMAQSGLHVPAADGTELAVFDSVFADIGDEQSIEQSLSTFSSHMVNIVEIIRSASSRSLVLLDELGAGTDPTEGACLAMAILAVLHERGVRTIATTHYSELKTFAHTKEGFMNASVEFDIKTLRPTYRLLIGVPGRSNAFAISRRLGLPDSVIQLAKAFMSGDEIRVEDLIMQLEMNQRQSAKDRSEAAQLRREMEELKAVYEAKLARIQEEKEEILRRANQEAQAIIQNAKQLADESLGRLRKLLASHPENLEPNSEGEAKAVRDLLVQARTELQKSESRVEEVRTAQTDSSALQLKVGMIVNVVSLNQRGEIIHLNSDGSALVQVGPMRMTVRPEDLAVENSGPSSQNQTQAASRSYTGLRSSKTQSVSPELDLRGATVEEALGRADKYLDDVFLAGLTKCRIIHGKGTGALRSAIRNMLDNHNLVRTHYTAPPSDGGDGVTVVELVR